MFAKPKIGTFRALVLATLHVALIVFPLAATASSSLFGDLDRSLAYSQDIDGAANGRPHDSGGHDDYGAADVHQHHSSDHSHETPNAVVISCAPAPYVRRGWWPAEHHSIDLKPCLKIKRPPRLPASA